MEEIDVWPPEKQLSLQHAGCGTLPTPMDLARCNIITSLKCALCQATHPTTNYILTGCPVALDLGRYTWRHDSVLVTTGSHSRTPTVPK